jgi:hypothetical protein
LDGIMGKAADERGPPFVGPEPSRIGHCFGPLFKSIFLKRRV